MDEVVETVQVASAIDWKIFIYPATVIVAAWFGFQGVLATLAETRQQTKDRETINYLQSRNRDDVFAKAMLVIYQLDRNREIDIRKYAEKDHRGSDEAIKIRYVLNQYEYLAVGVRKNTFNEEMLKDAILTTTIKLFERTEPLIIESRERRPKAYVEFEWLVERWRNEKELEKMTFTERWQAAIEILKGRN